MGIKKVFFCYFDWEKMQSVSRLSRGHSRPVFPRCRLAGLQSKAFQSLRRGDRHEAQVRAVLSELDCLAHQCFPTFIGSRNPCLPVGNRWCTRSKNVPTNFTSTFFAEQFANERWIMFTIKLSTFTSHICSVRKKANAKKRSTEFCNEKIYADRKLIVLVCVRLK